MTALELQKRRCEHYRLRRDMQQIPLDHRHRALQAPEFSFVGRHPPLHPHHAIEQAPTGQPQHGEDRQGDDQFQQGEPALLIHEPRVSNRWHDARRAYCLRG
ncbi:hypothetical protein D9M71_806080 [compost metagenome]